MFLKHPDDKWMSLHQIFAQQPQLRCLNNTIKKTATQMQRE